MGHVVIMQAPPKEGEFRLGLEQEKLRMYETGNTVFEIPIKNGKLVHGLGKSDIKTVEDYYGKSLSKPEDLDFWTGMHFELKNHVQSLDMDNPHNILLVSVAQELGICASSTDQLLERPNDTFMYVIKDNQADYKEKLTIYQRQDEALANLTKAKKTSQELVIALAFYATPNPYEIGTDHDLAYTRLRELIMGNYTKTMKEGVDKFMQAYEIDKAKLYASRHVKMAIRKNIIRRNSQLAYYNPLSNIIYGNSEDAIIDYLLNPVNQEEYGNYADAPPFSIVQQLNRT